ncbi:MAG: DGQHR domain-containing protein [Verrucomicrobiae bacterium]|nr:DGQHR domain-containing protein [Verrucomicrobiae bacterium]
MKTINSQMMLPCLRGTMGDWVYYVALMKFSELAKRVSVASEIHSHEGLKDLLQRALSNRAEGISSYLCNQKQHFFNSIILGVYEGDPKWTPINVSGNEYISDENIPDIVHESIGVITLSGSERLFAVDGQHRIEGLKAAVKQQKKLGEEEQSVVFVAHKNTKKGKERTRRLFSSLNRYAKPVTLAEIIALDEDDVVAIVTRELLENHPVLSITDAIYVSKTKTVPRTNKTCITSIHALYECLDKILSIGETKWKEFKKIRPSDAEISNNYRQAYEFWNALVAEFEPLQGYQSGNTEGIAAAFRNEHGGHLLFRPVGLSCITQAIRRMRENGVTLNDAVECIVNNVPMDLSHALWSGLLWESGKKKVINNKAHEAIAVKVILKFCRIKLSDYNIDEASLLEDYCSATNKDTSDFRWPVR